MAMRILKPLDTARWAILDGARRASRRWLGQLVWSTIGEIALTTDQMAVAYTRADLDPATIPAIGPRYAFQRATTALAAERLPQDDGTRLNILVRPIKETDGQVLRGVVEERVDSGDKRLTYTTVAHLLWTADDPDTASVIAATGLASPSPDTLARLTELDALFAQARVTFNGRAIRDLVARLLEHTHPVSVRRGGGVIFVPQDHALVVQQYTRLVEAFRDLSGHDGTEAYAVPVINRDTQRLMVKRAAQSDIRNQLDALFDKCAAWIAHPDQRVFRRSVTDALATVARLNSMIATYEQLTEDQLVELRTRATQVASLVGQVALRVDID